MTRSDVQRILRIEVPVIVRLAHRAMRVREVMQLASGSIIEFDKAADAELDLMINNEIVGYGQAVKVGENFGLRVLRILSLQEKIAALGVGRGKD
ncbi:MAG: FliM/FliN family flagellar motor switch protein [Phycisphaerae bacterium]|nr:FliM/FliN family flagellar motor switch protein [Phycisphaerae bacterium]